MITSSYAWRSNRIVRWGLLVSLILHILLAMLYFAVQPWLLRALHRPVAPLPRSREEIVTISNARKIERHDRVRVQTGHPAPPPHRQVVATVRKPLTQAAPPVAPVVPRPRPVVTPVPQPPTKRVHEIVKRVAQATPEPPKTVKEKTVTEVASAPPATPIPKRDEPSAAPEKQVALGETPRQAQRPPRQFSPEQLQKINDDLAKSIAQDRAENNPLNTRTYQTPAATTRHFAFQLSGVDGRMRVPQGLCSPIKSWVADGWDYYYVSCNVAFSDGTSDIEAVPWPVRFAPKEDYFRYDVRPVSTDLALPLPGWTLSPGIVVGEGVRAYARAHGFNL